MEPVSPELVLVDRALAERVQLRLREPDDTLARIEGFVQASRRAALAQRSIEIPRQAEPRVVEASPRIARPRSLRRGSTRRRPAVLAGVLAAGTLIVGLLLGVRVDLAGNPAGADTTVLATAPPPIVAGTTTGPTKTRPSLRSATKPTPQPNPQPQRFAWAPVPDASAYHVELFRGSAKVFEGDTAQPSMTIPVNWVFEGRSRSLEPGTYRWYVWPVTAGTRSAQAVVQARLSVPPPG